MSIVAADIKYYKSNGTDSTGGTITATEITDNILNNLFDDVSASESEAGLTDYRKLFVKNTHATLSWTIVQFWRQVATTSADDEITLGIGTASDDDGSNILTTFSGAAKVALISDGADTRNVTVVGEVGGVRTVETVALNGAVEVLTTATFDADSVYLVYPASADASRTVTIKQGTGGTTRGTIGPNKLSAICYKAPTTSVAAFELGDIAAGASQALWLKRVVNAGAAAASANTGTIRCQGTTT